MRNKCILYISSNDGSDMRINKEVGSLLKKSPVIFIGAGKSKDCFLAHPNLEVVLISGSRKSPITIIRQFVKVLLILLTRRIHSVHVINEQLMLFFWPLLWWKHTVLDVFDSIFLKANIQPEAWIGLKKFVYAPINEVLVTDDNRKALMPHFLHQRTRVLPNYPEAYRGLITKPSNSDTLTILFFGWLGMNRGGNVAKGLLDASEKVRLIMMGWFSDEGAKELATHERTDYRGVVPQKQALEVAATAADYILCVYEPINLNNINASPNKIYDAIQTNTPLIINAEVKVSALVSDLNIGVVMPTSSPENYTALVVELQAKKHIFKFPDKLKQTYTWEQIETELWAAHQL